MRHGARTSVLRRRPGAIVTRVRQAWTARRRTPPRARCQTDRNTLMTIVTTRARPDHRSRYVHRSPCARCACLLVLTPCLDHQPLPRRRGGGTGADSPGDEGVFVLNGTTNELLHYQSVSPSAPPKHIVVPPLVFAECEHLVFHNDLLDCRIDICSPGVRIACACTRAHTPLRCVPTRAGAACTRKGPPPSPWVLRRHCPPPPQCSFWPRRWSRSLSQVLPLFAENFDYADVRRDFVNGILESDILTSSIYVHIAENAYAARVDSIRTYAAIRYDDARAGVPFSTVYLLGPPSRKAPG